MSGHFLDTNILLYAFGADEKVERSQSLLKDAAISVQCLNEFARVTRGKQSWSWPDVEDALTAIVELSDRIVSIDVELHTTGIGLAKRYNLSIFDALIVAAALRAECEILYSEDMQHGLLVGDCLRIINPYRD